MEERQNKLLKEIVESYIKTARPVGSNALCEKLNCSSATIRNEMAALESLGYIEKNHISSGRIPSEKGYKYYVDNLMKPKELSGEDILNLQTIFSNKELQLSDAINKCMDMISDITNYTSIVLGKNSKENLLQQVSIIPLGNNKVVALVCTDKGIVESKQFSVDISINISEIVKTSEIINKMLFGTPIDEVNERLEFEIKPIISKQIEQYEAVYGIFYDAFNDFVKTSSNVHISGKSKIFNQPEYQDAKDIKKLVNKFDDENLIKKIDESSDTNDIKIYIGDENEFDDDVTIIKSKYHIKGEEGTIAIVGPKRMEYDRVVGLLDYINKYIESLEKGDSESE